MRYRDNIRLQKNTTHVDKMTLKFFFLLYGNDQGYTLGKQKKDTRKRINILIIALLGMFATSTKIMLMSKYFLQNKHKKKKA